MNTNHKVSVAVIGYGYWGPNITRNFMNNKNSEVACLCELSSEKLAKAKGLYPFLNTISDVQDVFNDPKIDAVCIATPVFTHYELAKKALLADKHVLIEKPMASSIRETDEILEIAAKKNLVVMVDHTYIYHPAVEKIKKLIETDTIGKFKYFDSTRINLGIIQSDVNVLWDLAVHDLSILFHILNEKPISVNATGISHIHNGIENLAYLTLNYSSDLIAHFNCSWSSPVKIRHILIGGDKKMIVFNDLEPNEIIKIYDTGFTPETEDEKAKVRYNYRIGDVYSPVVEKKEALANMAEDFIQAIIKSKKPISSGEMGRDIICVLEAAQTSIKNNGKEVKL